MQDILILIYETGIPGDIASIYKLSDVESVTILDNSRLLCDHFGLKIQEKL